MLKIGGIPGAAGCLSGWAAMEALNNLKEADGLLDACTLRLFTQGPTPNTSQVWLDYTEATFGGYAGKTPLVWAATGWEDGYAQTVSVSPAPVFTATNGTTPNTIKGWAITKTIDSVETVIYAENFAVAKAMTMAGHQIIVPATVNLKTGT